MTSETILLRQAHPNFVDGENLTSQVFIPFPKDDGNLSVYNGDQVTAADSYEHYTEEQGLNSDSVWGVSKEEADALDVPAAPDPLPGNDAHAKIQFGNLSQKECRKIAKKLKQKATARGCLYNPGTELE